MLCLPARGQAVALGFHLSPYVQTLGGLTPRYRPTPPCNVRLPSR